MSVVAAAVVGSAVVGGVMANKAGKTQAAATGDASAAQLQAQRETNEMQWDMYEQNRKDQAPREKVIERLRSMGISTEGL